MYQHAAPGGWRFVAMPIDLAKEIRQLHRNEELGWGRLKVIATIGEDQWSTSIWFDTKSDTYLLPIKSSVRLSKNLCDGDTVHVTIHI